MPDLTPGMLMRVISSSVSHLLWSEKGGGKNQLIPIIIMCPQ